MEFHHALPTGLHEKARDIVKGWMAYCSKAKLLSRAFISLKGFYYEAVIPTSSILGLDGRK